MWLSQHIDMGKCRELNPSNMIKSRLTGVDMNLNWMRIALLNLYILEEGRFCGGRQQLCEGRSGGRWGQQSMRWHSVLERSVGSVVSKHDCTRRGATECGSTRRMPLYADLMNVSSTFVLCFHASILRFILISVSNWSSNFVSCVSWRVAPFQSS